MSALGSIPTYLLSTVILLGAFSRFTHGAAIIPCVDTVIGLTLLFGPRTPRVSAAAVSLVFSGIGLAMQVQAGKDFFLDIALIALASLAVLGNLRC
ncbi:hypothetical protein BJX99DRAFT_255847 [Aspergillus californicus]